MLEKLQKSAMNHGNQREKKHGLCECENWRHIAVGFQFHMVNHMSSRFDAAWFLFVQQHLELPGVAWLGIRFELPDWLTALLPTDHDRSALSRIGYRRFANSSQVATSFPLESIPFLALKRWIVLGNAMAFECFSFPSNRENIGLARGMFSRNGL